MTGLKSGSGDDLWADDGGNEDVEEEGEATEESADVSSADAGTEDVEQGSTGAAQSSSESTDSGPITGGSDVESEPVSSAGNGSTGQPYIVRRAIQDKSVQFERDERLTFFVHDDVVEGERELLADAETALGRDVPKFDIREAVYRAALRNKEDVIAELVKMGYSTSE
jgi:hypothetical protein